MIPDKYYVFSHLACKNYIFNRAKDALYFYNNFVGDAMLMKNGKVRRKKEYNYNIENLIHAGLFILHGIIKDEYHTIDPRFLRYPSKETIDYYKDAIAFFKSPGNGLGLFGETGTGKSTLMAFLNMAAKGGYIKGLPFQNVRIYDIMKHFKTEGLAVIKRFKLDEDAGCNICIDDLGRDNGERKQYGDTINILGEIIQIRYDALKERGLITHFTTNCSPEELQNLYDPPKPDHPEEPRQLVIWGRLREMTNHMVIEGSNYRLTEK